MEIVYLVIIVLLTVYVIWQIYSRRKLTRHLRDITINIADILHHESAEKVLVPTRHDAIQELLVQINRLIDVNQKIAADYAKAKDSQKKLISNMSHDLKTPLTVILGYTEKLIQNHTSAREEDQQIAMRLHQKVNDLIALVNQFFDLVKLEAEDVEIPLTKLSLNEICRRSMLEYYELLQSKKLHVELDIPDQPYYILGNKHALQRVLSNLISNAIRYGSEGGVLGLTVREAGEVVAVDVWDRGKGIAEADQERVFDRLYTLDDARNWQFQGSGLGLSISKRLTEQMNGTIHVTSIPFEKTTFTLTFKPLTY